MFGNLINNSQIKRLISNRSLSIRPYNPQLLQLAQYPLNPLIVSEVLSENDGKQVHYFTEKNSTFRLNAKSYYWIDINEMIVLPVGIVGRFIPSSNLIEKGLALTAGKVEKPFGDNGERIRFGIYNYLETPVSIDFNTRIAYIQFMDLRGLDNYEYKMTKYDIDTYNDRRGEQIGPNYEVD
jgi:deoxycytidine triphosphate deaminase